jgi:hypothetical protein
VTIWCMYIACWIAQAANTQYVIVIAFHCNIGCRNARHSYVICTLPVLFLYNWPVTCRGFFCLAFGRAALCFLDVDRVLIWTNEIIGMPVVNTER